MMNEKNRGSDEDDTPRFNSAILESKMRVRVGRWSD
jgi:hypothetical protein